MTKQRSSTRKRDTSGGFIIVAVLWILGALATLASIYALYVSTSGRALGVHNERLQAQALVVAGVELSVQQAARRRGAAPTRGEFGFRLGGRDVATAFLNETARIDLNFAPKELLSGLFVALGAKREDADGYAERIVDWRTPLTPGATDTEGSNYRTAALNYGPRHGPFPHVNELALVRGLPPILVERATPYLTVYSGKAGINILDAAPEALAALPGMTPERLHALLAERETAPQNVVQMQNDFLGPAARYATTEAAKTMRVTVSVLLDGGRRLRTEAVVLMGDNNDPEPYRVLTWQDDLDENR